MAYKIYINSLGDSGSISAYLPEELNLSLDHKWENPFEVDMSKETMAGIQWIGKQFGDATANFDPTVLGDFLNIDSFVYMGSSPMTLSLELEFIIKRNIEEDLVAPVKQLMKMSCPKPGSASSLSSMGKPDLVRVQIPGVLEIEKAYITSIGVNLMKPLVSDGDRTTPQRVRMPISIIRAEVVTTERLEAMLFPKS